MKIWIDDNRPAPEGYIRVIDYQHFQRLLHFIEYSVFKTGTGEPINPIDVISFDHDLGIDEGVPEKTGADCARLFCEMWIRSPRLPWPEVYVHSANPVAREKIESVFASAMKVRERTALRLEIDADFIDDSYDLD